MLGFVTFSATMENVSKVRAIANLLSLRYNLNAMELRSVRSYRKERRDLKMKGRGQAAMPAKKQWAMLH